MIAKEILEYGEETWCQYLIDNRGNLHREDGPALECIAGKRKGNRFYYNYGKLHRIDGPAVEFTDGYKEYWVNNIRYSFEEYKEIIKYMAFI